MRAGPEESRRACGVELGTSQFVCGAELEAGQFDCGAKVSEVARLVCGLVFGHVLSEEAFGYLGRGQSL